MIRKSRMDYTRLKISESERLLKEWNTLESEYLLY